MDNGTIVLLCITVRFVSYLITYLRLKRVYTIAMEIDELIAKFNELKTQELMNLNDGKLDKKQDKKT